MKLDMTTKESHFEKPRIDQGVYTARFVGCEPAGAGEYGPRIAWQFNIPPFELPNVKLAADYPQGVTISTITGATISRKSRAGDIIRGLGVTDEEWSDGEFDTSKLNDRACRVVVKDFRKQNTNGKTEIFSTVSDVISVPQEATSPQTEETVTDDRSPK